MPTPSKAFKTTVQSWGNSCGIELPFNPKDVFGKVRVPVAVTIRGHTFRTTVCAMHGSYWFPLNKANRDAAGVKEGDRIAVTLTLDDTPRTVTPPKDLLAAIRRTKGAKAAWDALSFTHQREHVEAIESAKKPETRSRRIAKAIEVLSARA